MSDNIIFHVQNRVINSVNNTVDKKCIFLVQIIIFVNLNINF